MKTRLSARRTKLREPLTAGMIRAICLRIFLTRNDYNHAAEDFEELVFNCVS
jgi:hypothetical protein